MSDYIKLGTAALVALFIVWFSYDLGMKRQKSKVSCRLKR